MAKESGTIDLTSTYFQPQYGSIPQKSQRSRDKTPWRSPVESGKQSDRTKNGKCFICGQRGHYARQCTSKISIQNAARNQLQQGVSAIHLVHDLLTSFELDPDSRNQTKPSSTFLNNDVEQFEKFCSDASHGQQKEIDATATLIDPEEKIIANYVASHFVQDSGIPYAQIIMPMEEENQDFDQANN